MRCISTAPSRRTALLAALSLTACYDTDPSATGSTGPGTGTGGPLAVGVARYQDVDGDGTVSAGDGLVLRFDRAVSTMGGATSGLALPTERDELGSGAALVESSASPFVRLVLGSGAQLRTRGDGRLGAAMEGSASALALGPEVLIEDAAGNRPESTLIDILPQHVARAEDLPAPAGSRCVVVRDLDGDGALEALIGGAGESGGRLTAVRLEENGTWTELGELTHDSEVRTLLVTDLDGDGQLEAVAGTAGVDRVARLGLGGLAWVADLPGSSPTESLAAADLDRDGQLELLVGRSDGAWRVTAPMGDAMPELLEQGPCLGLVAGDLDGDGWEDLVIATADSLRSYRSSCAMGLEPWGSAVAGGTTDLAVGDADGDGILELAAAGPWGLRTYSPATLAAPVGITTLGLGAQRQVWWDDHDGDTRPSVFGWGRGASDADQDALTCWPEPLEPAVEAIQTASPLLPGASLGLADLDRDGDLDALSVGAASAASLRGSFSGTHGDWILSEASEAPHAQASSAACSGDVDGDGDEDLLVAELGTVTLWRNDDGLLVTAGTVDTGANRVEDLALADLDQDGHADLLTVGTVLGLQVFRGDGTGSFEAASALVPPTAPSNALALGDLDGDGDLDLVLGTLRGQPDLVLENLVVSSTGGTQPGGDTVPPCTWAGLVVTQELSTKMTHDLALDDVDADGDLDVVFGHGVGELSASWRNDGTGAFTQFELFPDGWATHVVLFAELWGDAGRDLLLFGEDTTLLRRNQEGSFPSGTGSSVQLQRAHTTAAALADLNGDGALDLVTTHDFGLPTRAWFGPWPEFTGPADRILPALDMHQVLAVDLDRDGAQELFLSSEIEGVPSRLFLAR